MSKLAEYKKRLETSTGVTETVPNNSEPVSGDDSVPIEPTDQAQNDQTNKEIEMAEQSEAYQAGVKAANDRMNKVFASEHFAGREASAAMLLGKEALSADDAIDILAAMPKVEQNAVVNQEEANQAAADAGRAEMKAAIAGSTTIDLAASDDGGVPDTAAKADDIWTAARSSNVQKGM